MIQGWVSQRNIDHTMTCKGSDIYITKIFVSQKYLKILNRIIFYKYFLKKGSTIRAKILEFACQSGNNFRVNLRNLVRIMSLFPIASDYVILWREKLIPFSWKCKLIHYQCTMLQSFSIRKNVPQTPLR